MGDLYDCTMYTSMKIQSRYTLAILDIYNENFSVPNS